MSICDQSEPKQDCDVNTLFAANVRRLRTAARWTSRAFGEHAGLSSASLYKIENAKQQSVTLATAEKLARALGVHVSTLVSAPEEEPKEWNGLEGHALAAAAIKGHRARLGWTQVELAARAEVQRDILSKIESQSRTPTLKVLERLAAALGVDTSELLSRRAEE